MIAVEAALDARTAPLDVFFRDDDGGWAMDSLDRLLGLFSLHVCPVDIAVIPDSLDAGLAVRLKAWRAANHLIGFHQHGYAHRNHEPADARKCEFGPSRSIDQQCADISVGQRLMSAYLGDTDPIFTPPWNRCATETVYKLPQLGFRMFSADRPTLGAGQALAQLPVTFDWDRACREDRLEKSLVETLSRDAGPVGVMLHHASLDSAGFAALDRFVGAISRSRWIKTRSMRHWLGR